MRAKILSIAVLTAFMSSSCAEKPSDNTDTPIEYDSTILRLSVSNLRKCPVRQIIFKGNSMDALPAGFTVASDSIRCHKGNIIVEPAQKYSSSTETFDIPVPDIIFPEGYTISIIDGNGNGMSFTESKSTQFEKKRLYNKSVAFQPEADEKAFMIVNAASLNRFFSIVNDGFSSLNGSIVEDITFDNGTSKAFTGIKVEFEGLLLGNSHKIDKLTASSPLISAMSSSSTVSDLELGKGCKFTVPQCSAFGAIAASTKGSISGCRVSAEIIISEGLSLSSALHVGAIAGECRNAELKDNAVLNSMLRAGTSANVYVGGIAGFAESSRFNTNMFYGTIRNQDGGNLHFGTVAARTGSGVIFTKNGIGGRISCPENDDYISVKSAANRLFAKDGSRHTETDAGVSTKPSESGTYYIDNEGKAVKFLCLSFDDGPNTKFTPELLSFFKEQGIVASFFVIGKNIDETTKKVVKEAYDMGCTIENHTMNHTDLYLETDPAKVKAEEENASVAIQGCIGERPQFIRLPLLKGSDLITKIIDLPIIRGLDINEGTTTVQNRIDRIYELAGDGTIFLCHDGPRGGDNTVQAVKATVPELIKQGYRFVTVRDLFKIKGVVPETHTGTQYKRVPQ